MRDHHVGQVELLLEVLEQVDDLGLDRHVEGRDRLVGHDQLGLERERAGDADALALAAGELVRVAVVVLGVQPDGLEQRPAPPSSRPPSGSTPCSRYGAPTILPTVCRGFSEEYGSWKIIWMSRRSGRIFASERCVMSRALEGDLAAGRLEQPGDQARRWCSCRSRTRRRSRTSRRGVRRSRCRRRPARRRPARCRKPPRIGKCLTRPSTVSRWLRRRVLRRGRGPVVSVLRSRGHCSLGESLLRPDLLALGGRDVAGHQVAAAVVDQVGPLAQAGASRRAPGTRSAG